MNVSEGKKNSRAFVLGALPSQRNGKSWFVASVPVRTYNCFFFLYLEKLRLS
jgi:hypothetical protein